MRRAQILLESRDLLGPRNWHDVRALCQQPGEAELSRGAAFLSSDRLDPLDQRPVLGEVVAHEAGMTATGVARVEMGKIGNDAGQQAAAERCISEKGNAEVA